jgi:outer membrane protein OmpA-like peptidoglycan-associated protein
MFTNPFRTITRSRNRRKRILLRGVAATAGGLLLASAFANPAVASPVPVPTSVDLGSAASFSLIAGAAATIPGSTLPGDVGAITAITDDAGTVYGSTKHLPNDAATQKALADANGAFGTLDGLDSTAVLAGADLGGQTLTPGVYHSAVGLSATSAVTFDAGGDPDAYFIIQGDAALGTTAGIKMNLVGGAQASHIFWVLKTAVTLGASSSFDGTVLSEAAISVGASVHFLGRAISLTAAVTLDADVFGPVVDAVVGAAPDVTIAGGPNAATGDSTPTISGTTDAPAGTAVLVTIGETTLQTTVLPGGTWTVTVGTALPDGPITVTASVTPAGALTGTATQSLTIDTTAPAVTINGGKAASTTDSTPTISGTSDAPKGTLVSISVGDQTVTTTVSGTGAWSVTSPALGDGVVIVVASVSDAVGNVGTATQSLTVDTTAPSLTITGGSAVKTRDSTPTISGTTDAPLWSIVSVTVAGQSLKATVESGGTWSTTVAALPTGAVTVVATVTDPAGNTAKATQTLTVLAPIVHHLSDRVYFNGDSSVITSATRTEVAALIHRVPANAVKVTVQITGYIKLIGRATENKQLATARAQAVYLLMKGKVAAVYTLTGVGKGLSYSATARHADIAIAYTLPDGS